MTISTVPTSTDSLMVVRTAANSKQVWNGLAEQLDDILHGMTLVR